MDNKEITAKIGTLSDDIEQLKDHIDCLDKELRGVRDTARDVLHVAIGVDGRNGLRGNQEKQSVILQQLVENYQLLKDHVDGSKNLKDILVKAFLGMFIYGIVQICGVTWYLASEHASLRELVKSTSALQKIVLEHINEDDKIHKDEKPTRDRKVILPPIEVDKN